MADMWINGFRTNMVCYDKHAKEFVRISNGTCTLDHSSPNAFKIAHDKHAEETGQHGCLYAPSEAAALRCVGVTKNGDPIVAFTYRAVRLVDIQPAKDSAWPDTSKMRPSRFIGRV